jgi:hypothetical protein
MRVRATWYNHFFANRNILLIYTFAMVLVTACEKIEVNQSIASPPIVNDIILDAVVPNFTYSNDARISLDATLTLHKNYQRPIYFSWTCTSFPSGSVPRIQRPNEARTIADSLVTGKYVFMLSVNDELGHNVYANFEVRVLKDTLKAVPPNIWPLPDVTLTMPVNTVPLIASSAYNVNPPGRLLFFKWTVIQQPPGSDPPIITNITNSTVNLSRLWAGIYLVQLQVTNELGLSSRDTVEVKVLPDSLSGTTRIFESVPWILVNNDWQQYLYLNIAEPETFIVRNIENTEVTVWDQQAQAWLKPNELRWYTDVIGLTIYYTNYPLESLINTKTKVRVRFF